MLSYQRCVDHFDAMLSFSFCCEIFASTYFPATKKLGKNNQNIHSLSMQRSLQLLIMGQDSVILPEMQTCQYLAYQRFQDYPSQEFVLVSSMEDCWSNLITFRCVRAPMLLTHETTVISSIRACLYRWLSQYLKISYCIDISSSKLIFSDHFHYYAISFLYVRMYSDIY